MVVLKRVNDISAELVGAIVTPVKTFPALGSFLLWI